MSYKGLNVLESEELRNGIKSYSNWPTIPQLYVKGEFVGGCDIVREMFQAGELQDPVQGQGPGEGRRVDLSGRPSIHANPVCYEKRPGRMPGREFLCAVGPDKGVRAAYRE